MNTLLRRLLILASCLTCLPALAGVVSAGQPTPALPSIATVAQAAAGPAPAEPYSTLWPDAQPFAGGADLTAQAATFPQAPTGVDWISPLHPAPEAQELPFEKALEQAIANGPINRVTMPTLQQAEKRAKEQVERHELDEMPEAVQALGLGDYAKNAPAGPASPTSANMYCQTTACPIEKVPLVYLTFWGFNGLDPAGEAPYLTNFFNDVGGSGWADIQTQYDNPSRGYITNPTAQLGGVWYDNDPVNGIAASALPDVFLTSEALRSESHFGWNRDATYMIMTPTGRSTAGFAAEFCAWHTSTTDSLGRNVAFANIPYLPDDPYTCPGIGGALDSSSIVAGHEYGEAVTDPIPVTGWTGPGGGSDENGDKCAWLSSGPGRMQYVTMNGHSYAVQGLWSNAVSGCAVSLSSSLTANAGGSYSGTSGSAISISGSATGATGSYTCAWSGTGATFGSASSCSTTVTYSSTGTKTLTLTVTDSGSHTDTDTASVTVTASPVTASAGGPYSGTVSTPISIAATGSGGTTPYSCSWTGTGASFASASSCSTTVTYSTSGSKTITVTVTDSASSSDTDSATVTVGSAASSCLTDPSSDALVNLVGLYEITQACGQDLGATSTFEVKIDTVGMSTENTLGPASPAGYTVYVDGVTTKFWTAYHTLSGWTVVNGGGVVSGTASSTGTTLTMDIPYSAISTTAGYAPTSFRVTTWLGNGVRGGVEVFPMDSAPDVGFHSL
jgi:serine protease